jgi:hypothetical protein
MVTVYERLLRLYPAAHREQFGEEMLEVFGEAAAEAQDKALTTQIVFCAREFAGILRGAVAEHLHIVIGADIGNLHRRFTMRDGFRFPKSTAVLMSIILAGVIMAIKRGEDIWASLPHVNPQIAPIQSKPSTMLPPIVFYLLFFYAAGLIGWLILYALRRSGIHRLDEITGQPK